MASWQTFFLVKMMTLWNILTAIYSNVSERTINFFNYLKDYFHGHHDRWLFVPGHTFPLSLANLSNSIYVSWIYDNSDTSLSLCTDDSPKHCKFSWLSAKIKVKYHEEPPVEFVIDNFLEHFTVNTVEDITPSLYTIFMCWCAHTKHWFKLDDDIEIHIIDDMGEEHVLTLHEHDESLIIRRNKIYLGEVESPQNEVIESQNTESKADDKKDEVETEKSKDD